VLSQIYRISLFREGWIL